MSQKQAMDEGRSKQRPYRSPKVRRLLVCDLDAVLSIQAASPEAASWSRADYERFCLDSDRAGGNRGLRGWVAERDEVVVGFLIARQVADELEVLNLAVAAAHRRAGIGSLLLERALEDARRVYLEVRASNHAAVAFYRRHGFALTGRRPRYYADPVEDALVLSRALLPPH